MGKTYTAFLCDELSKARIGEPIYSCRLAEKMELAFGLGPKVASAAVAVALKRILDGGSVPELRAYQKGIYYRAAATPFGEVKINKEQLIADKYLLPDIGYETGLAVLHYMGLTTQMPRVRSLATNVAKDCARADRKLGVLIRPPKVKVTRQNKAYLQTLDALEIFERAPIDAEQPYKIIAEHIDGMGLRYDTLLALADNHYNHDTIMQLAHTAGVLGVSI